ncbi:hypothetical protein KPL78_19145 [Roseomonas sp. HJA6]|uniref:Uncharacterized protein n=1 Tax=Roseomonas alba TaxID=2846776 RepID=A0ABS7ACG5_9PROT|nr:hypothetical protein [Neoroseomonas alba]MBW6399985.1 hypothetical protein [Neoroseomonas alba]
MTTRADIRDQVVTRLRAVPLLAGRVYPSRAWPLPGKGLVDAGKMPAGLVYANGLRRTSTSGGTSAPTFRTILPIVIHLRAEGTTVEAVDATLDALEDEVDRVLLGDPTFVAIPEELPSMEFARQLRADSDTIIGETLVTLDMQFTEAFEPRGLPPLTAARIVIDAIDPADRAGSYPAIDPFPAPAGPPRDRGPDGRPEAADITITFDTPA